MEESRLRTLRRKQMLYMNILFVISLLLFFTLVISEATAPVIYTVLGLIFLISPLSLQIVKRPNPFLLLFPGMKELFQYEKEKLGESWRNYHTSGFILQMVLSLFFFIQAMMREADAPFMEGIPSWYLIVIPLILFVMVNMNTRFHARRIDQKTEEQLKAYAYEKMLFSIVFASVALVMTVLGAIVVIMMT